MTWAPKFGIEPPKLDDEPRPLSLDQISEIVQALSPVKSFDPLASEVATRELQNELSEQLRAIELAPSMFEQFKETILKQYNTSRVAPGTMVGVRAAEALGESSTQMSLNTFHKAGSKYSVSSGINALKELIHARKERKKSATIIHFNDKYMTYEQVLDKQIDLVEMNVKDIVERFDVASEEIFNRLDSGQNIAWKQIYSRLYNKRIPEVSRILRLYMNTDKMYKHRISMQNVVTALENAKRENEPLAIICFPSPISIGIIDIYPNEAFLCSRVSVPLPNEIKIESCLYDMYRNFNSILIKGAKGVQNLLPVVSPVWNLVLSERRVNTEELVLYEMDEEIPYLDKIWHLTVNQKYAQNTGIPIERLIILLTELNIEVLREFQDENGETKLIFVKMPNDMEPGEYVSEKIQDDKSKIYNLAHVVYAEVTGSNLYDILSIPGIDKTYTICNNIHTIAEVLGIEAARAYFIQDLSECILNAGSYINIRNITLMADFIFSKGIFLGVTHTGISRQEPPAMDLATHQKGAIVLSMAAASGRVEPMQISSQLIAGTKPIIGTNTFSVLIDSEQREKIEKMNKIRLETKKKTIEQEKDKRKREGLQALAAISTKTRAASAPVCRPVSGESRIKAPPKVPFVVPETKPAARPRVPERPASRPTPLAPAPVFAPAKRSPAVSKPSEEPSLEEELSLLEEL